MASLCMHAQGAQVAHSWVWPATNASVAMERYITAFQHDSAMRTLALISSGELHGSQSFQVPVVKQAALCVS